MVYGGGAGGGKTFGLLLDPCREGQIDNKDFRFMFFRRTYPEITNPGSMWDESKKIYAHMARSLEGALRWVFWSGAECQFGHIQHEQDLDHYYSAQIPYIGFDQLETFTEKMFWFMLSRNRSGHGFRTYLRATVNPDANSFVYDLVRWWIDDAGYPIPKRAGVVRYLLRVDDEIVWGDSRDEMVERYSDHIDDAGDVRSFTFIPASIYDNEILRRNDPGYVGRLRLLPKADRERLLEQRWVSAVERRAFPEWDDRAEAEIVLDVEIPSHYNLTAAGDPGFWPDGFGYAGGYWDPALARFVFCADGLWFQANTATIAYNVKSAEKDVMPTPLNESRWADKEAGAKRLISDMMVDHKMAFYLAPQEKFISRRNLFGVWIQERRFIIKKGTCPNLQRQLRRAVLSGNGKTFDRVEGEGHFDTVAAAMLIPPFVNREDPRPKVGYNPILTYVPPGKPDPHSQKEFFDRTFKAKPLFRKKRV